MIARKTLERTTMMIINQKVSIHFGATCTPLREQLGEYGTLPKIESFQADADAITRLYLRDVLSGHEKNEAHRRLFKKIKEHIEENINVNK